MCSTHHTYFHYNDGDQKNPYTERMAVNHFLSLQKTFEQGPSYGWCCGHIEAAGSSLHQKQIQMDTPIKQLPTMSRISFI